MRIAVSSDWHLDLNHADLAKFTTDQVRYLTQHQIDYYFFLGDAFNDFAKTRAYFHELAPQLPRTKVYYLAGNHDMLANVSYDELEHDHDQLYFHDRYLDLPTTNWRVIGNNGWYDYSFSQYAGSPREVDQWKRAYWVDRQIRQPFNDQQRMAVVMTQVYRQLADASRAHKQVIFLTHFVPINAALPDISHLSLRRRRMGEMTLAMMGSKYLGQLLATFPEVRQVFYGHLHDAQPLITVGGIDYRNCAVGVWRKSKGSWNLTELFKQWVSKLGIIEL